MTIVAGYWPAAIDFMYSGRPKTRRNRPAAAACFSCSESENIRLHKALVDAKKFAPQLYMDDGSFQCTL